MEMDDYLFLDEEESKRLEQFVMEATTRRKCPTVEDLSIESSYLVSIRLPTYGDDAVIPVTTMKRWIAHHGWSYTVKTIINIWSEGQIGQAYDPQDVSTTPFMSTGRVSS